MAGFAVAVAVFSWSMANLALSSDLVSLMAMLRMAGKACGMQGKQVCFQVRASGQLWADFALSKRYGTFTDISVSYQL